MSIILMLIVAKIHLFQRNAINLFAYIQKTRRNPFEFPPHCYESVFPLPKSNHLLDVPHKCLYTDFTVAVVKFLDCFEKFGNFLVGDNGHNG